MSKQSDASTTDVDRIVDEIQAFSQSIEDPDQWRILIPTGTFDSVKDRLDVNEEDLGTDYNGITLCYTQHFDETRVEYKSDLSDHLQSVDAEIGEETDDE